MNPDTEPIPAELTEAPEALSIPPVHTNLQELPFEKITWQNFERLCVRLMERTTELRGCRRHGEAGEDQAGIDLYGFREATAKFTVCQCRNVENMAPNLIRSAIEDFLSDVWAPVSDTFILAVRDNLTTEAKSLEIAAQTQALHAANIAFEVWDSQGLSLKLKANPDLVADFFSMGWVAAFCGYEALHELRAKTSRRPGPSDEERHRMRRLVEAMTL